MPDEGSSPSGGWREVYWAMGAGGGNADEPERPAESDARVSAGSGGESTDAEPSASRATDGPRLTNG